MSLGGQNHFISLRLCSHRLNAGYPVSLKASLTERNPPPLQNNTYELFDGLVVMNELYGETDYNSQNLWMVVWMGHWFDQGHQSINNQICDTRGSFNMCSAPRVGPKLVKVIFFPKGVKSKIYFKIVLYLDILACGSYLFLSIVDEAKGAWHPSPRPATAVSVGFCSQWNVRVMLLHEPFGK